MVRKKDKLKQILEDELSAGLNITNMKYYHNNSIFTRIFNAYNEGLPNCLRLKNCMRRRKMVLKQMERIQMKPLEDNDLNDSFNTDDIYNNDTSDLEGTQDIRKQALQETKPKENITLQEMEISALEILMNFNTNPCKDTKTTSQYEDLNMANSDKSLKEQMQSLESNCEPGQKRASNVDSSLQLNERQGIVFNASENINCGTNVQSTVNRTANYLSDSTEKLCNVGGAKVDRKNFKISTNESQEALKLVNDHQRCNISHPMNLKNQKKTLDAYEVSDNSVKVTKYRKVNKSNQKKRKNILSGERKPITPLRKFVFFCNDCTFKVDPIKIFNVNDRQKHKKNKSQSVVEYIRKQYRQQNDACILAHYDHKLLKSSYVAYFTCKFPRCCLYRFKITADGHTVVDRSGDVWHAKYQQYVKQMTQGERFNVNNRWERDGFYMERNSQVLSGSDDKAKCVENIHTMKQTRDLRINDLKVCLNADDIQNNDSSNLGCTQLKYNIGKEALEEQNPDENGTLQEMEISVLDILMNFNTNVCYDSRSKQNDELTLTNPNENLTQQIQSLESNNERYQNCAVDCLPQLNESQNVLLNMSENVLCGANAKTIENCSIDITEKVFDVGKTMESDEALRQVHDRQMFSANFSRCFGNNQMGILDKYKIEKYQTIENSTANSPIDNFEKVYIIDKSLEAHENNKGNENDSQEALKLVNYHKKTNENVDAYKDSEYQTVERCNENSLKDAHIPENVHCGTNAQTMESGTASCLTDSTEKYIFDGTIEFGENFNKIKNCSQKILKQINDRHMFRDNLSRYFEKRQKNTDEESNLDLETIEVSEKCEKECQETLKLVTDCQNLGANLSEHFATNKTSNLDGYQKPKFQTADSFSDSYLTDTTENIYGSENDSEESLEQVHDHQMFNENLPKYSGNNQMVSLNAYKTAKNQTMENYAKSPSSDCSEKLYVEDDTTEARENFNGRENDSQEYLKRANNHQMFRENLSRYFESNLKKNVEVSNYQNYEHYPANSSIDCKEKVSTVDETIVTREKSERQESLKLENDYRMFSETITRTCENNEKKTYGAYKVTKYLTSELCSASSSIDCTEKACTLVGNTETTEIFKRSKNDSLEALQLVNNCEMFSENLPENFDNNKTNNLDAMESCSDSYLTDSTENGNESENDSEESLNQFHDHQMFNENLPTYSRNNQMATCKQTCEKYTANSSIDCTEKVHILGDTTDSLENVKGNKKKSQEALEQVDDVQMFCTNPSRYFESNQKKNVEVSHYQNLEYYPENSAMDRIEKVCTVDETIETLEKSESDSQEALKLENDYQLFSENISRNCENNEKKTHGAYKVTMYRTSIDCTEKAYVVVGNMGTSEIFKRSKNDSQEALQMVNNRQMFTENLPKNVDNNITNTLDAFQIPKYQTIESCSDSYLTDSTENGNETENDSEESLEQVNDNHTFNENIPKYSRNNQMDIFNAYKAVKNQTCENYTLNSSFDCTEKVYIVGDSTAAVENVTGNKNDSQEDLKQENDHQMFIKNPSIYFGSNQKKTVEASHYKNFEHYPQNSSIDRIEKVCAVDETIKASEKSESDSQEALKLENDYRLFSENILRNCDNNAKKTHDAYKVTKYQTSKPCSAISSIDCTEKACPVVGNMETTEIFKRSKNNSQEALQLVNNRHMFSEKLPEKFDNNKTNTLDAFQIPKYQTMESCSDSYLTDSTENGNESENDSEESFEQVNDNHTFNETLSKYSGNNQMGTSKTSENYTANSSIDWTEKLYIVGDSTEAVENVEGNKNDSQEDLKQVNDHQMLLQIPSRYYGSNQKQTVEVSHYKNLEHYPENSSIDRKEKVCTVGETIEGSEKSESGSQEALKLENDYLLFSENILRNCENNEKKTDGAYKVTKYQTSKLCSAISSIDCTEKAYPVVGSMETTEIFKKSKNDSQEALQLVNNRHMFTEKIPEKYDYNKTHTLDAFQIPKYQTMESCSDSYLTDSTENGNESENDSEESFEQVNDNHTVNENVSKYSGNNQMGTFNAYKAAKNQTRENYSANSSIDWSEKVYIVGDSTEAVENVEGNKIGSQEALKQVNDHQMFHENPSRYFKSNHTANETIEDREKSECDSQEDLKLAIDYRMFSENITRICENNEKKTHVAFKVKKYQTSELCSANSSKDCTKKAYTGVGNIDITKTFTGSKNNSQETLQLVNNRQTFSDYLPENIDNNKTNTLDEFQIPKYQTVENFSDSYLTDSSENGVESENDSEESLEQVNDHHSFNKNFPKYSENNQMDTCNPYKVTKKQTIKNYSANSSIDCTEKLYIVGYTTEALENVKGSINDSQEALKQVNDRQMFRQNPSNYFESDQKKTADESHIQNLGNYSQNSSIDCKEKVCTVDETIEAREKSESDSQEALKLENDCRLFSENISRICENNGKKTHGAYKVTNYQTSKLCSASTSIDCTEMAYPMVGNMETSEIFKRSKNDSQEALQLVNNRQMFSENCQENFDNNKMNTLYTFEIPKCQTMESCSDSYLTDSSQNGSESENDSEQVNDNNTFYENLPKYSGNNKMGTFNASKVGKNQTIERYTRNSSINCTEKVYIVRDTTVALENFKGSKNDSQEALKQVNEHQMFNENLSNNFENNQTLEVTKYQTAEHDTANSLMENSEKVCVVEETMENVENINGSENDSSQEALSQVNAHQMLSENLPKCFGNNLKTTLAESKYESIETMEGSENFKECQNGSHEATNQVNDYQMFAENLSRYFENNQQKTVDVLKNRTLAHCPSSSDSTKKVFILVETIKTRENVGGCDNDSKEASLLLNDHQMHIENLPRNFENNQNKTLDAYEVASYQTVLHCTANTKTIENSTEISLTDGTERLCIIGENIEAFDRNEHDNQEASKNVNDHQIISENFPIYFESNPAKSHDAYKVLKYKTMEHCTANSSIDSTLKVDSVDETMEVRNHFVRSENDSQEALKFLNDDLKFNENLTTNFEYSQKIDRSKTVCIVDKIMEDHENFKGSEKDQTKPSKLQIVERCNENSLIESTEKECVVGETMDDRVIYKEREIESQKTSKLEKGYQMLNENLPINFKNNQERTVGSYKVQKYQTMKHYCASNATDTKKLYNIGETIENSKRVNDHQMFNNKLPRNFENYEMGPLDVYKVTKYQNMENCITKSVIDSSEKVSFVDETVEACVDDHEMFYENHPGNFENNQKKTLDANKVSEKRVNVSKTTEYRKIHNVNEKKKRNIVLFEKKRPKPLQKFIFFSNDCSFKVDPIKIFNGKHGNKRGISKRKSLLKYICNQYRKQNNECVLAPYAQKLLNSSYVAYFSCKFPRCCSYRFQIMLDGHTVVDRSGNVCHGKEQSYVKKKCENKHSIFNRKLHRDCVYVQRNFEILNGSDNSAKWSYVQNVQKFENNPELRKKDAVQNNDTSYLDTMQLIDNIGKQNLPEDNQDKNVTLQEMEMSALDILMNFNTNACYDLHSKQNESLHVANPDKTLAQQIQTLDSCNEQDQKYIGNFDNLNYRQKIPLYISENVHCKANAQTMENGSATSLIDSTEKVFVMDETIETLQNLEKNENDSQEALNQFKEYQRFSETLPRNFENNQQTTVDANEESQNESVEHFTANSSTDNSKKVYIVEENLEALENFKKSEDGSQENLNLVNDYRMFSKNLSTNFENNQKITFDAYKVSKSQSVEHCSDNSSIDSTQKEYVVEKNMQHLENFRGSKDDSKEALKVVNDNARYFGNNQMGTLDVFKVTKLQTMENCTSNSLIDTAGKVFIVDETVEGPENYKGRENNSQEALKLANDHQLFNENHLKNFEYNRKKTFDAYKISNYQTVEDCNANSLIGSTKKVYIQYETTEALNNFKVTKDGSYEGFKVINDHQMLNENFPTNFENNKKKTIGAYKVSVYQSLQNCSANSSIENTKKLYITDKNIESPENYKGIEDDSQEAYKPRYFANNQIRTSDTSKIAKHQKMENCTANTLTDGAEKVYIVDVLENFKESVNDSQESFKLVNDHRMHNENLPSSFEKNQQQTLYANNVSKYQYIEQSTANSSIESSEKVDIVDKFIEAHENVKRCEKDSQGALKLENAHQMFNENIPRNYENIEKKTYNSYGVLKYQTVENYIANRTKIVHKTVENVKRSVNGSQEVVELENDREMFSENLLKNLENNKKSTSDAYQISKYQTVENCTASYKTDSTEKAYIVDEIMEAHENVNGFENDSKDSLEQENYQKLEKLPRFFENNQMGTTDTHKVPKYQTMDQCTANSLINSSQEVGFVDKTSEAFKNFKRYENYTQEELDYINDYDMSYESHARNFENNQKKTLDAYKMSENTEKISKITDWQKKMNTKEKKKRNVERKRLKPLRNFVFFCHDCSFTVNPIKIFNSKLARMRKITKIKSVLDYLRNQYRLQNDACILAHYDQQFYKSCFIAYFSCKFPRCCAYRFKITLDGHTVVDRSGDICHAKHQQYMNLMCESELSSAHKKLQKDGIYMTRNCQKINRSDDNVKRAYIQNVKKLENSPELRDTDDIERNVTSYVFKDNVRNQLREVNQDENVTLQEMEMSALDILMNFNTNACYDLNTAQNEISNQATPDENLTEQIETLDSYDEQDQKYAKSFVDGLAQLNQRQEEDLNMSDNVHCGVNVEIMENCTSNFIFDSKENEYIVNETAGVLENFKRSYNNGQEVLKLANNHSAQALNLVNDHQMFNENIPRNLENNQKNIFDAYKASKYQSVEHCTPNFSIDSNKKISIVDETVQVFDNFQKRENCRQEALKQIIDHQMFSENFSRNYENDQKQILDTINVSECQTVEYCTVNSTIDSTEKVYITDKPVRALENLKESEDNSQEALKVVNDHQITVPKCQTMENCAVSNLTKILFFENIKESQNDSQEGLRLVNDHQMFDKNLARYFENNQNMEQCTANSLIDSTQKVCSEVGTNESLTNLNEIFNESHPRNLKNNQEKSLDKYEVSDNSVYVSKKTEFRKIDYVKAKKRRIILRGDRKRLKEHRQLIFFRNDCSFTVDPTKIFNSKDGHMVKISPSKFVLDYIRNQYRLQNDECILAYYDQKFTKSCYVVYFSCKFPRCCTFRFKITLDGQTIVDRSGDICHAKELLMCKDTPSVANKKLQEDSVYMERNCQIPSRCENSAKCIYNQNAKKTEKCAKLINADDIQNNDSSQLECTQFKNNIGNQALQKETTDKYVTLQEMEMSALDILMNFNTNACYDLHSTQVNEDESLTEQIQTLDCNKEQYQKCSENLVDCSLQLNKRQKKILNISENVHSGTISQSIENGITSSLINRSEAGCIMDENTAIQNFKRSENDSPETVNQVNAHQMFRERQRYCLKNNGML